MKVTEDQVVAAYWRYLKLAKRKVEIELTRAELHEEMERRHDAMSEFQTLELQYLGSA